MVKRVTPIEADALLKEGWVYLDVRSIPEFEGGHPTGAANIPLLHMAGGRMAPNPAFQAVVAANYPKDAKIVVGCKAGGRSLQAATLMEALARYRVAGPEVAATPSSIGQDLKDSAERLMRRLGVPGMEAPPAPK